VPVFLFYYDSWSNLPSWLCHECGSQASQRRCLLASIRRGAALFAPQKASTHLRHFTDSFFETPNRVSFLFTEANTVRLPHNSVVNEVRKRASRRWELAHISRAKFFLLRKKILLFSVFNTRLSIYDRSPACLFLRRRACFFPLITVAITTHTPLDRFINRLYN
jgi:hypothetical protein